MTLGRHLVVSLVALATAAFAAGCGGDDGGNDVMRATLTGDGCRYQGDTTPAPGPFTVEVRNQTSELANFQLIQLPEGTKPKDIEGWFNKARQQYEQTGRFTLPHIMWVSSTLVSPHAASELPGNVSRGSRLAVLCASASSSDAKNNPHLQLLPSRVIAAAELDVTP